MSEQTNSKVYSFSTTDNQLQKKLDELQDDKIFSAIINKHLKKIFNIK